MASPKRKKATEAAFGPKATPVTATPPTGTGVSDRVPPRLNGVFLSTYQSSDQVTALARADQTPAPLIHPADRPPSGGEVILESVRRPPRAAEVHRELILGESDLLPFRFLRLGDRLGRAVVKIERADGAAGTGFVIAPQVIMTNHHVLPDPATATGARAYANYEPDPPADPAGQPAVVAFDPDTLFVTNSELDFTFCGIAPGLGHVGVVPVERDSRSILPSEYVNIIQHPGGRHKEVALQDSRVVKVDHVVVHYCCDTEPGSSGSPVFNNQWRLVAMHHASVMTDNPRGRQTVGGASGMCYLNEGVRISAVALWLESDEANTPDLRSQSARLRALIRDMDDQAGFFGALGRRAGARSAGQFVVDSYLSEKVDEMDLGFWNLQSIQGRFAKHLPDLAQAIAGMGMDVWCLTQITPEDLEALQSHLESGHQLDLRGMAANPTRGEPTVGLLARSAAIDQFRFLADPTPDGWPRFLVQTPVRAERSTRLLIMPVPVEGDGKTTSRRNPIKAALANRQGGEAAEVLFIGDGLSTRDLRVLTGIGSDLRVALSGEGGFAVIPGPKSRLGTTYAGPNLNLTLGAGESLVVAHDRRWPERIDRLGLDLPICLRLVLDRHAGCSPAGSSNSNPDGVTRSSEPAKSTSPPRLDSPHHPGSTRNPARARRSAGKSR